MFRSYSTDIIRVVSRTYDGDGVLISEIESSDLRARVEDANILIRDVDGKEVMPSMFIMFKYDGDLKYVDTILVKTKHGDEFMQPEKEWEIKKIEKLGMRRKTHMEVYL